MTIDYKKLLALQIEPIVQQVTARDAILYALGIGMGSDPREEEKQLPFIYEQHLQFLPTFSTVIAYPGVWIARPETGIAWKHCLNGEYVVSFYRQPRLNEEIESRIRITEVIDKGQGKGALIYSKREIRGRHEGDLVCTVDQTLFARADGGFGGPSGPVRQPQPIPETTPELICDIAVPNQAAAIYRLSGDPNPLHIDPAVATEAGYKRPILHGGATYGVAGLAVLKTLCGYVPARLKRFDVRFSQPVYPGDTIRTEMWKLGPRQAALRSRALERDVVVLNNGFVEFAS
jgi:acyl dehydratase